MNWLQRKKTTQSVSVKYQSLGTSVITGGCPISQTSVLCENRLGLSLTQYRTALSLLHQKQIFATLSSCFSFGESQQQSSFWSWKLCDSFLSAICLHKVSFTCPRAPTPLPAQQWFWSSAWRIKVLPLAVGLLFAATNSFFVRETNERENGEGAECEMQWVPIPKYDTTICT